MLQLFNHRQCLAFKLMYYASSKQVSKQVQTLTSKLRMKQTVADKQKLQQFLQTTIKDGKLQQNIDRTSKYDDGFKQFVDEFKQKHAKHSNILDFTHYSSSPLNKSTKLREEELRQIQEFTLKKQQGAFSNQSYDKFIENQMQIQADKQEDQMDEETIYQNRSGFAIEDDFFILLVDRDTNTQVTTLQRINTFRQLVFMGNGNGIIGYGKGKGYDFEQALQEAIKDAKRNLVPIPLDLWLTCPTKLESKFYDFKLEINPRIKGMNAYGNPSIAAMLMMTGITHCSFKAQSRNQLPYAMVYAFMSAVIENSTAQEISELTGQKVYRQYWGKKIGKQSSINLEGI